jgi:hypothetical protein
MNPSTLEATADFEAFKEEINTKIEMIFHVLKAQSTLVEHVEALSRVTQTLLDETRLLRADLAKSASTHKGYYKLQS